MIKENKKISYILVLLVVVSFLSITVAHAAGTPSIFSYQGRLTNSSGDLVGGTGTIYYLKFSIWNNPTVDFGTRLWPAPSVTLLSSSTIVRQGVFNMNIGDTGAGYPHALDYDFNANKDIYLQVEVSLTSDGTFEKLSPRQRISSTIFSQISGAVYGTGPSSFGTTTPFGTSVVSVEATSTNSVALTLRGILNQLANLFQIQDSTGANLFSINSTGGIFASSTLNVTGTTTLYSKLKVSDTSSIPQLRLSNANSLYGEFETDSAGDVRISSNDGNGGNIRQNNENLWVCNGGSCGVGLENDPPDEKGNVIVDTGLIFSNKFRLKQISASSTIMYDTMNNVILEFDEGGEGE